MKKYKVLIPIFLILSIFLSGCSKSNLQITPDNLSQSEVNIYFFDVGQADCTLFVDNDKTLLVDTGDIDTADLVLSYLKELNINKIDYLVLTHPHADHIGGASKIIENYDIGNILMPNKTTNTNVFEDTINIIEEKKYNIIIPHQNDIYQLDTGIFEILSDQTINWGDDLNYYSLVLKASFNDIDIIITGDADKEVEENIIKSNKNISAEILKLGHHGSYTSTSNEFLNKVNPLYAIISCGKNNSYGHPHDSTLDKLNNINYYRTDEVGTIIFSIKDNNIEIISEKENNTEKDTDRQNYVLNINSKKIHKENCIYVKDISAKNKKVYIGLLEDLIKENYETCKSCFK